MLLEGSCHCGRVTFSVKSEHPCPFNLCYCSICRKTAGGGGFAINLGADAGTLKVTGSDYVKVYRARIRNPEDEAERTSPAERHFCGECGSALWVWDPRWPELLHPFASAVDTPLPVPPERVHLMLDFRPEWVPLAPGPDDRLYPRYPDESIAAWHERTGMVDSG